MKRLLRSKTFWAGIGMIGYGVVQIVQGESGVESLLEGAGLIFLRHGIQKVEG